MTHTSTSGTPSPQGTDAFSPATQLATLVDEEADWNWTRVETNAANRNALASPERRKWVTVVQDDTGVKYEWTGAAWKLWESDWITWTPTMTNITTGNGTLAARYKYIAGEILGEFSFILGSTSVMGSSPYISLPSGAATLPILWAQWGAGIARGGQTFPIVFENETNTDRLLLRHYTGSPAQTTPLTSTSPFTWASTHRVNGSFRIPTA